MFTSDLNAGVVPQMSPPPHDLERLRTTMVDFIVLSIKLVFMVLGVSYSRVLAQRPTCCCSASGNQQVRHTDNAPATGLPPAVADSESQLPWQPPGST